MNEADLIDMDTLDCADDQVWLCKDPDDCGNKVDIVDWCLSLDWPSHGDEYEAIETKLNEIMDEILNNRVMSMPDKHKFDSRTYVKPKKPPTRPSIQTLVDSPAPNNKYLTYNKYSTPLGPILRHKTFNVDTDTANSSVVKEYAMKRKIFGDDDPQLEDVDMSLMDISERLSEPALSKPINIDLSQPAHSLHNTFNKVPNMLLSDRGSNMYQSGESLMRMSPPSLVCSLMMDSSGTFNQESLESRKSQPSHPDSGLPTSGRDSIDPMMTSMTLSILDEKDMSTSFLSQTTYHEHDSLIDSIPPSLVNSVNSSCIVKRERKSSEANSPNNVFSPASSRTEKDRKSHEPNSSNCVFSSTTFRADDEKKKSEPNSSNNVFSSATFTRLEHSERLLSERPRCSNMFVGLKKPGLKNCESYTKAREEACQIDPSRILIENGDKKSNMAIETPINSKMDISRSKYMESSKSRKPTSEEITLHYANNKFKTKEAGKENVNASFEEDDAFYKDMEMTRTVDLGKNSMNFPLDKQELNEIIQARQKLSLARKALPVVSERCLPNQVETTNISHQPVYNSTKSIQSDVLTTVNDFNATIEESEEREGPKRNATFRRPSPRGSVDTTVIFVKNEDHNVIDVNSATTNLVDNELTKSKEERAMVGSGSSTDTATFSSTSPPGSVGDTRVHRATNSHIASTPLTVARRTANDELMGLHNTISPIYNMVDDKSYTLTKASSNNSNGTYDVTHLVPIDSGTIVKRPTTVKRDILTGKSSQEKRVGKSQSAKNTAAIASHSTMAPPAGSPQKSGLPISKLRQYSSHKELRIPVATNAANPSSLGRTTVGRMMVRRNVYASNPALSPTAPPPLRRDSYTIATGEKKLPEKAALPLVRQGTEILYRDRSQSQLVQPKDAPPARLYSIAGASQLRVNRPNSVPASKIHTVSSVPCEQRPASGLDARVSALPRPTRLPAPRARLRPPSTYSVAPAADSDHY